MLGGVIVNFSNKTFIKRSGVTLSLAKASGLGGVNHIESNRCIRNPVVSKQ